MNRLNSIAIKPALNRHNQVEVNYYHSNEGVLRISASIVTIQGHAKRTGDVILKPLSTENHFASTWQTEKHPMPSRSTDPISA